jgi:hypothetical protein
MAYRGNDMVRRVLSGLLVLIVLMLPVGPADAMTLPVFETASHAALSGHDGETLWLTAPAVRGPSSSPCDGCQDPDGCACCPACGFGVGNLPTMQTASRPQVAASLSYLILSATPPDGLTSPPNLPPPRHIV